MEKRRETHESRADERGSQDRERKPFVAPVLTRRETLPNVTTGFMGTFDPNA